MPTPSDYMNTLDRGRLQPNFWCSTEYIEALELSVVSDGAYIAVLTEDGDHFLLPPLNRRSGQHIPIQQKTRTGLPESVWSDFVTSGQWCYSEQTPKAYPIYLDHEFIYNPLNFIDLSGGKWSTFRKNINKIEKRKTVIYHGRPAAAEALDVLASWADDGATIQDEKAVLYFLLSGRNAKALRDFKTGELLGINIWDENCTFVNFRYCWCKPIPFLSELMRYRFYTDPDILKTGKLVNDGGGLGRESLLRFKRKLHPVLERVVFSWKI